jgi:hypothetical protein
MTGRQVLKLETYFSAILILFLASYGSGRSPMSAALPMFALMISVLPIIPSSIWSVADVTGEE